MSLAIKILLLADVVTALLLIAYLAIKYSKIFSKRPKTFNLESVIEGDKMPEVTYEDKPIVGEQMEIIRPEISLPKEEEKKPLSEELIIGGFEELEKLIKESGEKKV